MKEIKFTTVEELCNYIPEDYRREDADCLRCIDTYIKEKGRISISLAIPEKIEVLKCAVFGFDNRLYTWYLEREKSLEQMPGELYQKLKIVCGGIDPSAIARSNPFTIEEGDFELNKLYDEKGNLM